MASLISTTILRTQSDERLVALARAGHERAFEAIVERYKPEIVRVLRRGMPAGAVDDVVQQTHFQAWKALNNGADVRNLRAWLHRIARNAAIASAARGYDYDELEQALIVSPGPDSDLERREVIRLALRGIAGLPERQRSALLSVAVEGRPHSEVALELGITDTAVRQLVHRARVSLRTAVGAFVPAPLVIWAAQLGSSSVAGEAAAGLGLAGTAMKIGAIAVAVGGVATATPPVRDAIANSSPSSTPTKIASVRQATAHATPSQATRAALRHGGHAGSSQDLTLTPAERTKAASKASFALPGWGQNHLSHTNRTGTASTVSSTGSTTSAVPASSTNSTASPSSSRAAMLMALVTMMHSRDGSTSSSGSHHSHTSSNRTAGTSTSYHHSTTTPAPTTTQTDATPPTTTAAAPPTTPATTTTSTDDQTPTTPATTTTPADQTTTTSAG